MTVPLEPLDPRIPHALSQAEAYPAEADADAPIEHVQTHLSHVFLTRSRVYKVRKAVRFDFVDFGTRAARAADCMRELTLNRRLAPDVYLGLAPIWIEGERLHVGEVRETFAAAAPLGAAPSEHCVVMQRLPRGRDALSLLQANELDRDQLEALAARIARFHETHPLGESPSLEDWRRHIEAPVQENFRWLQRIELDASMRERVAHIEREASDFMRVRSARFEERWKRGKAVDGHGDLHLQHVWFLPERIDPIVIDCVEFQDAFRQLDPASEVAFLAMDLGYRGRADLGEHFLRAYAACADDYTLFGVVDYYLSYRAMVRAKVAALAAQDAELPEAQRAEAHRSAVRHSTWAEQALAAKPMGRILAVSGTIGAGKTTVARAAAQWIDAAVLSSDRVRKRIAGLSALERTQERWAGGIFGEPMSDATYAGLLERAEPLLESGRHVVLDASYRSAQRRSSLRSWARARGVEIVLIEVRCDPERVRARLAQRRERGTDASDAGPEHLDASLRSYELPHEWPPSQHIVVATDASDWRETLHRSLTGLHAQPKGDTST